jgi:hypothetical protein
VYISNTLPRFIKPKEGRKTQLNKKIIAIIALIITLTSINVAIAAYYMTAKVAVHGGVAASGTIVIYQSDGQTGLTTLNIPDFQGESTSNTYFWIKNTGNVAVAINWFIANGNPDLWTIESGGQAYIYTESSQVKFRVVIYNQEGPDGGPPSGLWSPSLTGTEVYTLQPGKSAKFSMDLQYTAAVNTIGGFDFDLSFSANST